MDLLDWKEGESVEYADYIDWIPRRLTELRLQKNVSARDMSLSLGQSPSYIGKIENRHALPSMTGFLYICEYLEITPQDFFNTQNNCPSKVLEISREAEKLTFEQADHVLQ
ncbi:MAG: helix-turn-helix domain-containing protein, partial [Clostridiales bacterium]|nr:helix-turn-helix domain-containing protein [Clostridiales bacterium]